MSEISPKERAELAAMAGVSEQYLYQCLTGIRNMGAKMAMRVEAKTQKRVRRWDLRRDWYETWPELRRLKGAPEVPEAA